MPDNFKRTLCFDFDGVLHGYQSGWKGAGVITDPPVPGAIEYLTSMIPLYLCVIHSSRFNNIDRYHIAVTAVERWLIENGFPQSIYIHSIYDWPDEIPQSFYENRLILSATKPPATMTIDDRAVTFLGMFPSHEQIEAFRPWNKKGEV